MSCVKAVREGRSQMVQVVSMEDVTMRFGEGAFQEKDVNGAGEVVFLDCISGRRRRAINVSHHIPAMH
jgi:hypothetical protein